MKIMTFDEASEAKRMFLGYMSMTNKMIVNILSENGDTDVSGVIPLINKINNQGVEEIDLQSLRYRIKGKWLGIAAMARSEMLFLITYLAIKANMKSIIYRDLMQLERSTFLLYCKEFSAIDTDDCIAVAFETEAMRNWYKRLASREGVVA